MNPEFVERYQILYQQDPGSRVFAPLAEAYRRMGMIQEAFDLCVKGVKKHPNFPGGRLAFAKILLDREEWEAAVGELRATTELSPENIMAHQLLADALLKIKKPKEALHSFKSLLFLNPQDQKALKMVARLESLTADEYDDDVFRMERLSRRSEGVEKEDSQPEYPPGPPSTRTIQRYLSLTDAYIARNDIDRALETLKAAEKQFGSGPEIARRTKFLEARAKSSLALERSIENAKSQRSQRVQAKVDHLKKLINRIEARRHDIS